MPASKASIRKSLAFWSKQDGSVDVPDENKDDAADVGSHHAPQGRIRTLLEVGTDPALKNAFGLTALDHTKDIHYSDPETATLLNAMRTDRFRNFGGGECGTELPPQ